MSEYIEGYKWEQKFCWLPKICNLTNDIIWLEHAYRGKRRTLPGYIWHSTLEHHKWADNIKRQTAKRFT